MSRPALLRQLSAALEHNDGSLDKFNICCKALKDACKAKAEFTADEETEMRRTVNALIDTWKDKIERNAFLKWYSAPPTSPDHLSVPESFERFYEALLAVDERIATLSIIRVKRELKAIIAPYMDEQGIRPVPKPAAVSDRIQITLLSERRLSDEVPIRSRSYQSDQENSAPPRPARQFRPSGYSKAEVLRGHANRRLSSSLSPRRPTRHGRTATVSGIAEYHLEIPPNFVPQTFIPHGSRVPAPIIHEHIAAAARQVPVTDFLKVPESPDVDILGPGSIKGLKRTPSHRNMRVLTQMSPNTTAGLRPFGASRRFNV